MIVSTTVSYYGSYFGYVQTNGNTCLSELILSWVLRTRKRTYSASRSGVSPSRKIVVMEFTPKVLLIDFDDTLVTKDVLNYLIGLAGKGKEANRLAVGFQTGRVPGITGLIARINLLNGMSVEKIQSEVRKDLSLAPGAKELIAFCNDHHIVSILATGSINQVTDIYQESLGINYVVASHPRVEDGIIQGITESHYPSGDEHFKVAGISTILKELDVNWAECVAVGDGRGDIPMFEKAGYAVAINPKGGIEEYTDVVVESLFEVKDILHDLIIEA